MGQSLEDDPQDHVVAGLDGVDRCVTDAAIQLYDRALVLIGNAEGTPDELKRRANAIDLDDAFIKLTGEGLSEEELVGVEE